MPSDKKLKKYIEKGQITAMKSDGHSLRAIAKALNRSVKVVTNYLPLGPSYGAKLSPRKPEKLTQRQKKELLSGY